MPAKKQLRVGMKRTYSQNGVKVVDQLQAAGIQNGRQMVRWVRISPKVKPQRDIMDLDVGGIEVFENQKDVLDMDGGLGI